MMPLPIVDFPFTIGVMLVMLICGMATFLAAYVREHSGLLFLRDAFFVTLVAVTVTHFTGPGDAPAFFSALFTGLVLLDYAWYLGVGNDGKSMKRLAFILGLVGIILLVIAPVVAGGPLE